MSSGHKARRDIGPKKISALSFYLHLRTGKNWSGKFSPTLSNIKVGGTIVMVSDQAIIKAHKSVIAGGIMDETSIQWGKDTIKIVSVYRPADEKGTGSLRKAINKLCGGDLDQKFSEALSHVAGNSHTIIGGDFNLDPNSTARLLLKSGIRGALCEWDEYLPTFRRKHLETVQESKKNRRLLPFFVTSNMQNTDLGDSVETDGKNKRKTSRTR